MKLKKIANIVLTSILVFSLSQVGLKLVDYKKSEKLYSEIQEIVETKDENTQVTPLSTYEKMKKINPDYQFWIEVEGTNISYPVVQYVDNSFYLKKDFNKSDSSAGTIFMDALNNFEVDNNTVLYGHNMNNKTMFNNINLYKKKEFFDQNNKIKIKHTGDEKEYTYEVFSVYHSDNTFDYNTVRFGEGYSFMNFINDVENKSIYQKNLHITNEDKIITLSTCSYEFKGAKTTVHAKLIDTFYLNPEEQAKEEARKEALAKELEGQKKLEEIQSSIGDMIDTI